ncbi:MAG: DsrE family protein [Sulfurimonas sp. RIFOXYB2_FULL_37_5]|uniref:DsrE family protein n=1 Tax=unclassified Sulfurimonas TaxID=2623549 RepID=UPI0008AC4DA8|nr:MULTISPECIES: DsrE family protein [unclassified Sulfurimonas]MBS4068205.1 DsrE family protein [Sulfurimonas sp.]MDD3855720.1 DsrE family protein [Sulfurimonas sp.]OHE04244.1 MAG: DsrE family protein [Sulfurimonas sp. RIFOXYB12_FULL_35_9]OHE15913.1 MAG: DsrE family protein [Sulfurimonas sp. RIFOXYB2_FULL_37_5]
MKNKLLIVWSSADEEIAKKLILLYGSVMLPRGYWDEATIMIWGPSAKLLAESEDLQERVKTVMQTGVKFNVCVVCSDDYGVTDRLNELGVDPIHTGEMLTNALQSDYKVITF